MQFSKTTLFLVLLFISFNVSSQTNSAICGAIDGMLYKLETHHIRPVLVTPDVKQEIMELYVNEIDPNNYFLTLEELNEIKRIAKDDNLCKAFEFSATTYFAGVRRYEDVIGKWFESPVILDRKEYAVSNFVDKRHLRKSESVYNKSLHDMLLVDYLNMAFSKIENDTVRLTSKKQITTEMDLEWRDKIKKTEEIYIQRISEDSVATYYELYESLLNSIANRFDPHSNYFSSEEAQSFEEHLSKETLSFGIQLDENDEYNIEVTAIVPGSSAWRSGAFLVDDIIESVTTKDGVTHSFVLKGMEYASRILRDSENNELTFTLVRKSGERKTVKITKTAIDNLDNVFRGYILEQESTKLGYIALPSFYTNFESDAMLGCANDVAKEIILLKKEGIQGLVLDLRNNGGGSIKEAVELSGLFINEGPVCVLEHRDEKPMLLKDMNRGTVYDGPLIILVNNTSASASELVSGCLQDYQRALIVGDVTFGKGSAQSLFPGSLLRREELPPLMGELKITNGMFYLVSRRSNQSVGVVPDIILRDQYASIDYFKERNEKYHLTTDSTSKNVIFSKLNNFPSIDRCEPIQQRLDSDLYFSKARQYSDSLKGYIEVDQHIPLNLVDYARYKRERVEFMKRFSAINTRENDGLFIRNHNFVDRIISFNADEQKMNEEIRNSLQEDAIIQEMITIFKEFYTFE